MMTKTNEFKQKYFFILILLLIFLAGVGIRFFNLTNPPLDFNPVRQIHSAIIARGFYVFLPNSTLQGFERDKAWSFSSELWIEPPILEYLTAWSYSLAGGPYLWIARIYSILFWILGGFALYRLMLFITHKAGALTAVIFYLFLPFGIYASRAFQPDPLMVSLLIFSLWMLVRWRVSPTWKNALLTGIFCGLAILVKQVAVFFLAGPLIAVVLSEIGFRRAITSFQIWCMALFTLFPAVMYNIYGLFITGFLKTQYSLRFFPELFIDPNFYYHWAAKINQTIGWIPLLLAISGILFVNQKTIRWVLITLFGGYILYGFGFAYHISTHDYYQEPLIPLVAIGIGVVVGAIYMQVNTLSNKWSLAMATLLVLAGSTFTLWSVRNEMKKDDFSDQPALWTRLGREMNYGEPAVIGLFDDYGVRLEYWGLTMPTVWESSGDVKMRELAGQAQAQNDISSKLEGKRFFVVTDFTELDNQPDLKSVLTQYAIYEQGAGYRIYDLTRPLAAQK